MRCKDGRRFLSVEKLKRLGFVLDHAEDRQAVAVIRLRLFTDARLSEITGLRWARGPTRTDCSITHPNSRFLNDPELTVQGVGGEPM